MDNNVTNPTSQQVIIIDTLKDHCSKMGKKGGKSKSEAKMRAMRLNLLKANMAYRLKLANRRYNRTILVNNNPQDASNDHAPI